ncbi:hypothetical protein BXZ70DRAFT_886772 [Cristinia sonorae]|uniref:HIT-type domain-containing protein n=1 Tax=Cristinia sonorae TaxID=1940300 RepID=A0A8K0XTS2_9AGAR|nr:hypothetical protein BXZ70DRAFT_886772 [Cristinia sonorae]
MASAGPSTQSTAPVPPKPESVLLDPSASAPTPLCAICTAEPAKYTCPRCKLRSCSLPCSNQHKVLGEGCSGIRNKAAYVPMNQYGYMALMNDYTFLEEVGRKVNEVGREIVQGGYQSQNGGSNGTANQRGGRGRGRGRGRGGRGQEQTSSYHKVGNTSKRDVLRMELDFRDIEMDMLPVGMEKRTLNQSTWDPTLKTALLTVELVFHPPKDPYAPSSQAPDPPITILTHRNRLDETVGQCISARIAERVKSKKEKQVPQWLQDLVIPDPSDPESFQPPTCVMPTLLDPLASLQSGSTSSLRPGHIKRHGHYKLDFNQTLQTALAHKHFVEFPTLEIWEKDAFTGTLVDDGGAVMLDDDFDERRPKRRKLGAREGKKAISGLLGDYGSDEDEDEGGAEAQEEKNVFDLLAGYAGSDEDDPAPPEPNDLEDDGLTDDDAEGETDDELGEDVNPEELAKMLESLREAGALRDTSGDGNITARIEDEEQVDWGDSEDDG